MCLIRLSSLLVFCVCLCLCYGTGVIDLVVGNSIYLTERETSFCLIYSFLDWKQPFFYSVSRNLDFQLHGILLFSALAVRFQLEFVLSSWDDFESREGTSAMKIARKLAGGVRLRTLLNQRLNDGRSLEIALLLDKNSCIIVAQTIQSGPGNFNQIIKCEIS